MKEGVNRRQDGGERASFDAGAGNYSPLHAASRSAGDDGDELLAAWKARIADFPDDLARRMAENYLRLFPIWGLQERMASRDTPLWRQQSWSDSSERTAVDTDSLTAVRSLLSAV